MRIIQNSPRSRYRMYFLILVFAVLGTVILSLSFAANSNTTTDVGILYASKEGLATSQLFRADLDGNNPRQLTSDLNNEHEWSRPSPDGKSILFMKADKGSSVNFALTSNRLWVMNIDGTNQREIVGINKRNSFGWTGMGHAEWSPDSSKIVLAATLPSLTSQLFTIDASGNNPQQITQSTVIDGQNSIVADPSWANTNEIIFIRSWNCFGVCGNQDVFKMNYATRTETRVTNDSHWNFDPYLSPDGKSYIWLSFRSSNIICPCDLIRGNASGQLNPTAVIADDGANANGTFSSDGTHILFLKQVGAKQVLHRIKSDGTGLTRLGNGETGIASFITAQSSSANNSGSSAGSNGQQPSSSKQTTSNQSNSQENTNTSSTGQQGSESSNASTGSGLTNGPELSTMSPAQAKRSNQIRWSFFAVGSLTIICGAFWWLKVRKK